MFDRLYRIETGYFCCGIITHGDRVIRAAPIVNWMTGKTIWQVERWVVQHRGSIEFVPAHPRK